MRRKYLSVREEIARQSQEKLTEARGLLAARGLATSGIMTKTVGDSYAKLLKDLTQARVDALIDGFELYGVPVADDVGDFILQEANAVHQENKANFVKTAASSTHGATHIASIVQSINVPTASIRCQIEERQARPKMAPLQPQVTNVYHVTGANARVNVQSTDQS